MIAWTGEFHTFFFRWRQVRHPVLQRAMYLRQVVGYWAARAGGWALMLSAEVSSVILITRASKSGPKVSMRSQGGNSTAGRRLGLLGPSLHCAEQHPVDPQGGVVCMAARCQRRRANRKLWQMTQFLSRRASRGRLWTTIETCFAAASVGDRRRQDGGKISRWSRLRAADPQRLMASVGRFSAGCKGQSGWDCGSADWPQRDRSILLGSPETARARAVPGANQILIWPWQRFSSLVSDEPLMVSGAALRSRKIALRMETQR